MRDAIEQIEQSLLRGARVRNQSEKGACSPATAVREMSCQDLFTLLGEKKVLSSLLKQDLHVFEYCMFGQNKKLRGGPVLSQRLVSTTRVFSKN